MQQYVSNVSSCDAEVHPKAAHSLGLGPWVVGYDHGAKVDTDVAIVVGPAKMNLLLPICTKPRPINQ